MVYAILISTLLTNALTSGDAHDRGAPDAVFLGRTPCGPEARRFLGIPPKARCEFIAWNLVLSTDGTSRVKLAAVYGVGVPNQPGFEGGGTAAQLAGSWTVGMRRALPQKASISSRLTGVGWSSESSVRTSCTR